MQTIRRGASLVWVSFRLFRSTPGLLRFPPLLILLGVPLTWVIGRGHRASDLRSVAMVEVIGAALQGVFMVVQAAFIHSVLRRFRGEPCDFTGSWRFAIREFPMFGVCALGLSVLNLPLNQPRAAAQILSTVLLVAQVWLILTLPVMVQEKRTNLWAAAKRSARLVRQVFAEAVVVYGVAIFVGLLLCLLLVPLLLEGLLLAVDPWLPHLLQGIKLTEIGILAVPVALVGVGSLLPLLNAALYVFAAEGTVPGRPAASDVVATSTAQS